MKPMDVGPVRVFGAFETPRGLRCRAYWDSGRLYVMRARDRVDAFEVPERPVRVSISNRGKRTWEATMASGETMSITEEGCAGCGFTLMSVPAKTIPQRVTA